MTKDELAARAAQYEDLGAAADAFGVSLRALKRYLGYYPSEERAIPDDLAARVAALPAPAPRAVVEEPAAAPAADAPDPEARALLFIEMAKAAHRAAEACAVRPRKELSDAESDVRDFAKGDSADARAELAKARERVKALTPAAEAASKRVDDARAAVATAEDALARIRDGLETSDREAIEKARALAAVAAQDASAASERIDATRSSVADATAAYLREPSADALAKVQTARDAAALAQTAADLLARRRDEANGRVADAERALLGNRAMRLLPAAMIEPEDEYHRAAIARIDAQRAELDARARRRQALHNLAASAILALDPRAPVAVIQ